MVRIALQLAEILASFSCMSVLFEKKMRYHLGTAVLLVADLFLYIGINQYGFPVYYMSFSYLVLFIYGMIEYREGFKITLINCFLTVAVIGGLQLLFYLPVFYLFISKNGIKEVYELFINLCCLLTVALLGKKMGLAGLSYFLRKKNKLLILILGFMTMALGCRIYQVSRGRAMSDENYVQMIFFLILFFFTVNEWQKARSEVEQQKERARINAIYYRVYDEMLTTIRENQHDIKNHIQAIVGMIYSIRDYDELVRRQQEYCDRVMGHHSKTKILLTAENPLMVGFLYQKLQEAEEKDIKLEYQISLGSGTAPIPEYEMVDIIGILVDNAVEELETKTGLAKRVKVFVGIREEKVRISVSNVSDADGINQIGKFFKKDASTKGIGRGIGLFKLKNEVLKRSGEIRVSNEIYEEMNYLEIVVLLPIGKARAAL